jgi:hypothetical protein
VTLCNPLEFHTCFGELYCLRLQCKSTSSSTIKTQALLAAHFFTGYLLLLLLDPVERDSTSLGNVGKHLQDYTASRSGHTLTVITVGTSNTRCVLGSWVTRLPVWVPSVQLSLEGPSPVP